MEVAGIFLYPVKSLRGLAVGSAAVDELGLVGDRRFMVMRRAGADPARAAGHGRG